MIQRPDPKPFPLFIQYVRAARPMQVPYEYIRTMVGLTASWTRQEQMRALGLFCSYYDIGTAWRHYHEVHGPDAAWLERNWRRVKPIRKERRSVNTPARMYQCHKSLDIWLVGAEERLSKLISETQPPQTFRRVMRDVLRIRHFGRYISIRMAVGLHLIYGVQLESDSVFPGDAYLRKSLGLFFPQQDFRQGGASGLERCELAARDLRTHLLEEYGERVDLVTLSAMLCENRQMLRGHGYQPYQGLDEELRGILRAEQAGCDMGPVWAYRRHAFPHRSLGELQGWLGMRYELLDFAKRNGFVWDDGRYTYQPTSTTMKRWQAQIGGRV